MHIGDVIDNHFKIDAILGEGAAGQVFKVVLTQTWKTFPIGTPFALKYFKDEVLKRESESIVINRRVREIQTGIDIDHPHLIKSYNTSEFNGNQPPRYLLMKFLEGKGLDTYIREVGQLETNEIYHILAQLSSGIEALHKRNIVHRDIKSANIFITSDKRVVLLDLGVVRGDADSTITGSQAFLGTLRYAAPEWLFGESCSEKSDIYSLGAVAFHLITGKEIFDEINLYTKLVLAARDATPVASISDHDTDKHFLLKLVKKQLEKEPGLRPTLSEFIDLVKHRGQSGIWKSLRHEQLLELLPKGVNNPVLHQKIEGEIPDNQLDEIVADSDHDQLLSFLNVREHICHALGLGAEWFDYLALKADARVEFVEARMKSISKSENLGSAIESRYYFAELVRSVEPSPTVREKISCLLESATVEWEDMWQASKQENPSS